eukprot:scaffold119668_cov62-Attheya_sp.AAC.1
MGRSVLFRLSLLVWMGVLCNGAAASSDTKTVTDAQEVTVDARTGEINMHNTCEDNHLDCKRWHHRGRCDTEAIYMAENCPLSCGLCTDEPEETVPQLKNESICEDLDENCVKLATSNWCVDNIEYMTKNCPVTCGTCDDEEGSSSDEETAPMQKEEDDNCEDLDYACGRWARRGRCGTEATFMSKNCPLSCGICV